MVRATDDAKTKLKPLRVLSLFSGIGGIDLGLERAGMQIVAVSEVEPYACDVLRRHWPHVPNLGDITEIREWPDVDVIAGGFPCQDVSAAGQRAGLAEGTRSGLWTHFSRAIRDIRPRYVIVENVVGLRSKGMERILADLATCGFNARWDTLPAAAFGAPHLRERVCIVGTRANAAEFDFWCSPIEWAVANAQKQPQRKQTDPAIAVAEGGSKGHELGDSGQPFTHPHCERCPECLGATFPVEAQDTAVGGTREPAGRQYGQGPWRTEPNVGRVAHGVSNRVDRLRCLGNAVVPSVAQYVGEAVVRHYEGKLAGVHG